MIIDKEKLNRTLLDLLAIPSPCGFTDEIARYIADRLQMAKIPYELTRRGTIRAHLEGEVENPARAIVSHVDTIGAMVSQINTNGRISVSPIGHWSSRFAEGSRVILFSQKASYRGTLLPCVEWGVSRDHGVDKVEISWDNIELRLDEPVFSADDIHKLGIEIGDFIALDSQPEVLDNGFIIARNLDNKAGTATVLETIIALHESNIKPTHDTHVIFTIAETAGSGIGSAVLPEVSELVTVDFASLTPEEKSNLKYLTIASGDASGPFDYHLTAHLESLAKQKGFAYRKKFLKAFHSDAAAALVAGHDVRTAVVTYGGDASHSLERTHFLSLQNLGQLLEAYMMSEPTFEKDEPITTIDDFSRQITEDNMPKPLPPIPDVNEVIANHQNKTK